MSINKSSTNEEICLFLASLGIKDDPIKRFREEKIKGNELFFLTGQDYQSFGITLKKKKLLERLEQIKKSIPNILEYAKNIDINSKEENISTFLKTEILLGEKIIENFKDINGHKFKNLNEDDLKKKGLKLGERRKILSYISTMNNIKNI